MMVGDAVRIYYDEDIFDEGEIVAITDDFIDVDFYDWIERWTSVEPFICCDDYLEPAMYLQALLPGEIIADFRGH